MTPLWTAREIANATGGTASADFNVDGVTFDSREVIGGELFVAMRGDAADGHDFVETAQQRGAAGCLVERPVDGPHVRVADSFRGLQALGVAARARAKGATIIGVTGSVGKTGTKEALRRAFQRMAPDNTHWSVKSYNNHTGVPLSLARMPADSRYGVYEMGMNHSGEIAALTRMVRPHVALVTWVANAHIEYLGSEEAIAAAKSEIFEGVERGGTAVWPIDNPHAALLKTRAEELELKSLSFGWGTGADVRCISALFNPGGTALIADVAGEILHLTIGMAGRHWVSNALGVLATVKAAGGDIAEAGLALAELKGLTGRGARITVPVDGGTATVIDESYNANPVSMAAALAVLGQQSGRRLAILGEMRELGPESHVLHAGMAAAVAEAGIAELALVGPQMAALKVDGAAMLPDAEAATRWAQALLRPGDTLLVKGSNGVGLSRVVTALQADRA